MICCRIFNDNCAVNRLYKDIITNETCIVLVLGLMVKLQGIYLAILLIMAMLALNKYQN